MLQPELDARHSHSYRAFISRNPVKNLDTVGMGGTERTPDRRKELDNMIKQKFVRKVNPGRNSSQNLLNPCQSNTTDRDRSNSRLSKARVPTAPMDNDMG